MSGVRLLDLRGTGILNIGLALLSTAKTTCNTASDLDTDQTNVLYLDILRLVTIKMSAPSRDVASTRLVFTPPPK